MTSANPDSLQAEEFEPDGGDLGNSSFGIDLSKSDHLRFYQLCEAAKLSPEQIEFVDRAYSISKFAHRTQERDGGDRYFEHPKAVAFILIDEAGVTNPEILAAALLHDVAEDSHILGSYVTPTEDLLLKRCSTIADFFSTNVAQMVYDVSKDPGIPNQARDREREYEAYLSKLYRTGIESIIVKAADRLHNLRTLRDTSAEKQARKIQETRDKYLPLFEMHARADSYYQRPMQSLLDKINVELDLLSAASDSKETLPPEY